MNLILILICLTLISIIHILVTSRIYTKRLETISMFWSILILIYYNFFVVMYNKKNDFQFLTEINWIDKSLELNWGKIILRTDGISIFFIGLSILSIPICILMSKNAINHLKKEFLICLFIILLLLIGVFTTMDIILFYILFEGILIPMFLINGIWGSFN